MENPKPIVFLAFANEKQDESRYLRALAIEQKQIERSLEKAEQAGLCELVVKTNCELRDIWDTFQRYQDRIAIFHYGGHADGYQLLLETADGDNQIARAEGLVSFLGGQKSLKLVFLNGCSTEEQAIDLTKAGVPAVIGTANSINDSIATLLATSFYRGLAAGLALERAWKEAQDVIKTRPEGREGLEDSERGLRHKAGKSIDRFPWNLQFREGSREVLNNWNLPDASNNPLFGLPDIPQTHNLPESPFLFLKRYERKHAEVFFGRSYYIRDLYQKIVDPGAPPIILLYGQSGVGKSSMFDAGLVPRLEGVQDEQGEAVYEVRYLRRVRDLALGGTLGQGLAYTISKEEGSSEDQEVQGLANDETLSQIESLVENLEGETKEDFAEFMDRYRRIQRYKASEGNIVRQELDQPEVYAEGALQSHAGEAIRKAWRTIEAQSGKKLVIILDQVEELFTQGNPQVRDELGDFLELLQAVFALPDRAPQGKIILGYRKEYHPEIEERFKVSELPRTRMFLEKLRHKDLLEIFAGLTLTPRLRNRYNLSIEEGLAGTIADNLLKDKENPVAPVLQIVLTKMWNRANKQKDSPPHFSREMYNQLQREGLAMKEFFQQQMARVETWNPEVVKSGLALDVLEKHTTSMGTSQHRHIDELRLLYRHRPDVINALVQKFKEFYLLTEVHGETDQGEGYTALPHDTLAPIVMEEYNHSDKLGQRSFRILVTKTRDVASDEEHEARLDDMDLDVVEEGLRGMRDLNRRERELLEVSVIERERRLKLKQRLFQISVITGFILLILGGASSVLTVSAMKQKKKDRVLNAFHQSQRHAAEGRDSLALALANFAFKESDAKPIDLVEHYLTMGHKNLRKKNEQRQITDANDGGGQALKTSLIRPFSLNIRLSEPGNRIKTMAYEPGRGVLVNSSNGKVNLWSPQGVPRSLARVGPKEDVNFTGDGKWVQTLSGKHRTPMYLLNGKLMANPPSVKIYRQKAPVLRQDVGTKRSYDLSQNMIQEELASEMYLYDDKVLSRMGEDGIRHEYVVDEGRFIVEIDFNSGREVQYWMDEEELYVSDPSLTSSEFYRVNLRKRELEATEDGSETAPIPFSKGMGKSFAQKIKELEGLAQEFDVRRGAFNSYLNQVDPQAKEYIGEYNLFSGRLEDVRGNSFLDVNDFLVSWEYLEEGVDASQNQSMLWDLGLLSEHGDTLDLAVLFGMKMVIEGDLNKWMYNALKGVTEPHFAAEIKRVSRYLNLNYPEDSLKSDVPCYRTENVRMDSVVISLKNLQGKTFQRFTHPEKVYFIQALTDSSYANLTIDSGHVQIWQAQRTDTSTRWQSRYVELLARIRHKNPIEEVKFIADQGYILTQSPEEIHLHDFEGKPHVAIRHEGMKGYQLSSDRKSILTWSDSLVQVYREEGGNRSRHIPTPGHKIVTANFTDDNSKFTTVQTVKSKQDNFQKQWVYYWYASEKAPQDSFVVRGGEIEDATVIQNKEERLAVVLSHSLIGQDAEDAFLEKRISFWNQKRELKDQQFPPPKVEKQLKEFREKTEDNHLAKSENTYLAISPDRKHMIYAQDGEGIWLKDLEGEYGNQYQMTDGYHLGLGQNFYTSDNAFLIASRANSLLLWNPFPAQNENWKAEVASLQLDLDTKEDHDLDSIMDHVPGDDQKDKYFSLLLIVASLLYIFYATAKRLYVLVQVKDYLEIGLTIAVYFLFGAIILNFWSVGEIQVLSSLLPMVAISILVMRIPREYKEGWKLPVLTQSVVLALLSLGLIFLWYSQGVFSNASSLDMENLIWIPLSVIMVLAVLIALPVGLALRKRKQNNMKGFYNWMLLPGAMLSLFFWGNFIDDPDFSLLVFSLAFLLGIGVMYRQGKIYWQARHWLSMVLYFCLGFVLLIADVDSEEFDSFVILVWLSSFIQAIMAFRRKNYAYFFWTASSGIFLLTGTLAALMEGMTSFDFGDIMLFTLVSGIAMFAMRFALGRYYGAETRRFLYMIMGIALVIAAAVFSLNFGEKRDEDLYYVEDGEEEYISLSYSLAVDPLHDYLYASNQYGEVNVIDLKTDSIISILFHDGEINDIMVPEGKEEVLTASSDGYARSWDPVSQEVLMELPHGDWVRSIAMSSDQAYYLTSADDKQAHLWNVYNQTELATFDHDDWVSDAVFSPDGAYIFTVSDDSMARFWSLQGDSLFKLPHQGPISQAGFFPDGSMMFTVTENRLFFWGLQGEPIHEVSFDDWITRVAVTPDGQSLWVAYGNHLVQIDSNGNIMQSLPHEMVDPIGSGITAMTLVPELGYVVTAYAGTILIWDDDGVLNRSIPLAE